MIHNNFSDEKRLVETIIPIENKEENTIFGEDLPSGIILNTSTA
jgi:hypothetical protein